MRGAVLSRLPTSVSKPIQPTSSQSTSSNRKVSNVKESSNPSTSTEATSTKIHRISEAKINSKENGTLICPFCSFQTGDPSSLQNHVNTVHPDPVLSDTRIHQSVQQQGISNSGSQQSSALAREVCPVCQARFFEATDLVIHYESAHSAVGSSNNDKTCVTA
jgi:hypothetical protein